MPNRCPKQYESAPEIWMLFEIMFDLLSDNTVRIIQSLHVRSSSHILTVFRFRQNLPSTDARWFPYELRSCDDDGTFMRLSLISY